VWIGKGEAIRIKGKKKWKLVMLHPSTVITEGGGATAKTYSADSVGKKFIHQTVEWYYEHVNKVPKPKRKVWILQSAR
jgi:hypothetical protein